uniref:Uncharacterized protein n=1 Tax=Arundo donax TaxID=35708 RepID=A0A0A9EJP6_ARUDO
MLLFSFMNFSQSSDSSFSSFFFTPPFASGRHAAAATSATAAAAAAALSRVLLPQLLVPSSADAVSTLPFVDTLLCLSSTPTYVTQFAADLSTSELSHTVSAADLRSVTLNDAAASAPPPPRGSPSAAASSIGGLRNPRFRLERRLRRRWPSDVVSGRERGEKSSASSAERSPARSSKESCRPPDRSDMGSGGGGR